jgi:hypothetical protein
LSNSDNSRAKFQLSTGSCQTAYSQFDHGCGRLNGCTGAERQKPFKFLFSANSSFTNTKNDWTRFVGQLQSCGGDDRAEVD